MHKAKLSIYQVKQKKPSKFNSTVSPAKVTKQQIHDQDQIRKISMSMAGCTILLHRGSSPKEGNTRGGDPLDRNVTCIYINLFFSLMLPQKVLFISLAFQQGH